MNYPGLKAGDFPLCPLHPSELKSLIFSALQAGMKGYIIQYWDNFLLYVCERPG